MWLHIRQLRDWKIPYKYVMSMPCALTIPRLKRSSCRGLALSLHCYKNPAMLLLVTHTLLTSSKIFISKILCIIDNKNKINHLILKIYKDFTSCTKAPPQKHRSSVTSQLHSFPLKAQQTAALKLQIFTTTCTTSHHNPE